MVLRKRYLCWRIIRHVRPLAIASGTLLPFLALIYFSNIQASIEIIDAQSIATNILAINTNTNVSKNSTERTIFPIPTVGDNWRSVETPIGNVYFYSSYFDDRDGKRVVRILGAILTKKVVIWRKKLRCLMLDKEQLDPKVVQCVGTLLPEHWNLKYASYRLDCEVPSYFNPYWISVLFFENMSNQKLPISMFPPLVVHYPPEEYQGDIALCVKPFHYNYDRAVWLVEFIEFYKMMGVQQFIFYNHTVGPNVQKILEHYQSLNLVTVLPWDLPMKTQKEIRTEGIFTALNDCVIRLRRVYHYAVLVDLDEYIIPRTVDNYNSLIQLFEKINPNIGGYIFRNVFFYLYWPNDTHVYDYFQESHIHLPHVPYLITQFKTTRAKLIHKAGTRSKYIVKTEDTMIVGNHVVWKYLPGKKALNVNPNIALSHHYRICEYGGFECLKQDSEVDRTSHRFLKSLVPNVLSRCQEIFTPNLTCPEAPPLGSPW